MSTTDTTTCHHGLGPAHPWEPDRHCPPEPVEPAPDAERDERLQDLRRRAEAQAAAYSRMLDIGQGVGGLGVRHRDMLEDMLAWGESSENDHADTVLDLLAEITRLDAVVTAVRDEVARWNVEPVVTEPDRERRALGVSILRALDGA